VLLTVIVAGVFVGYRSYMRRPQAFIQQWSERFRAVNSLEEAKRFQESEPVYLRTFPSGEWLIATCEHSCCSGAGFDATVIRDSTGAIYADATHCFCGIEEMSSEFERVPAGTLAAFYPGLQSINLQRQ